MTREEQINKKVEELLDEPEISTILPNMNFTLPKKNYLKVCRV